MLKTDNFCGPSFLASALINGDLSGLSAEECRAHRWLEAWIRFEYGPRAQIVGCEDAGFQRCMSPGIPAPQKMIKGIDQLYLAGDCQFYDVLYSRDA